MSSITVYTGLAYSATETCTVASGETSAQVIWSYERDSSPDRWKVSKTVAISNNSFSIALSAAETAEYTHLKHMEWYYIHGTTGVKRYGAHYDVVVQKLGGSRDTASTIPRNQVLFVAFGQASVAEMSNDYTMPYDTSISKLSIHATNAPLGANVIAELYVDDVASGKTITLTAGTVDNTSTLAAALSVSSGEVVTCNITQTGTAPNEGSNVTVIAYYY